MPLIRAWSWKRRTRDGCQGTYVSMGLSAMGDPDSNACMAGPDGQPEAERQRTCCTCDYPYCYVHSHDGRYSRRSRYKRAGSTWTEFVSVFCAELQPQIPPMVYAS